MWPEAAGRDRAWRCWPTSARGWRSAGRDRDRPADLAPHRPHALGRALADRDQDLRRRPRRLRGQADALRAKLAAIPGWPTCRSKSRCWRRRSRCASICRGRAVRAGAAGADGDAAGAGRRREGQPDRRRRSGASRWWCGWPTRPHDGGPGPDPDRDTAGRIPAAADRQHRRGRRAEPDRRDDGKRRIVLSAKATGGALSAIVADIREVVAETARCRRATSSRWGQFPGAGGGLAPGRPAVARLADADVRGAATAATGRRRCRR